MKADRKQKMIVRNNKVSSAQVSDVSIHNESVNLVAQKRIERTRLHSICGVRVHKISIRVLCQFMNKNNIGDSKVTMPKPEMCNLIVKQNIQKNLVLMIMNDWALVAQRMMKKYLLFQKYMLFRK